MTRNPVFQMPTDCPHGEWDLAFKNCECRLCKEFRKANPDAKDLDIGSRLYVVVGGVCIHKPKGVP